MPKGVYRIGARNYMRDYMRSYRKLNGIRQYPNKRDYSRTLSARWHQGKDAARRRALTWNITREQHAYLIAQPCHYCSCSILSECGSGLDRLDVKCGYEIDNVVSCCGSCNYKKGFLERCGFTGQRLLDLVRESPAIIKLKTRKANASLCSNNCA